MSATAHNEGLADQLDLIRTNLLDTLKLRLYVNNFTPQVNHDIGDFTEATFAGYAAEDVPDWGAVALNGNQAETAEPPHSFTTTEVSAETVYGWYLTDAGETKVYASRPLDTPVPMNVVNKTVIVAPVYTLGDNPND